MWSLVIVTRRALPKNSRSAFSRVKPASSVITLPPVRVAISSNIALRRSPNPGALTAAMLTTPRILLTTKVARASFSMSSAIINKGLPARATFSRMGTKS